MFADAPTAVDAAAVLFEGVASGDAEPTVADAAIVEPSGTLGSTFTTNEKDAVPPAASAGLVHVIMPAVPGVGVVQLQPGGAPSVANVVFAGVASETATASASLGPPLMMFTEYVSCVPAMTGSGVAMTPIETSAETATAVLSAAESFAPFGSIVADDTMAVAGIIEPSGAAGSTVTESENEAEALLASVGAVHVTGPEPPIGGDVQFHPPGAMTEAKVVPAGVDCDTESDCASLGPLFTTSMA